MTKPNRSLIALIVDASGSMAHLRDATIEGITKLMSEQSGD